MKKYILLLIAGLLVGITTNIGHPITPYYINQIELDKIIFGYFYATMSLGMLISAPIWGALGDAKGRKIVLIICLLFYGVGQLLFGVMHNQYLILAARFFSGIFCGGVLVSLLSYMTRSKELSRFNATRLYATFISLHLVGTSVGSFIGGALGELFNPNYHYVLFAQALMMLIFAIYVLLFMKFDDEEKQKIRSMNPLKSLGDIKLLPFSLVIFLFIIAIINISFTDVSKYLDVYFSDSGYGSLKLGTVNLIVGFVTLGVNLLVTPLIIKKFKPLISLIIFSIIGGLMLILTFSLPNLLFNIYTFYMIFIITKAIIEPVIVEYLSEHKNIQSGVLMGLRQSFISLGGIIGVLIGGIIYANSSVMLFYICAGMLFIAAIITFIIYIIKKKDSNLC
ncbi:MAG: MFS transporter [Erysipelotrichaceae bacterium]|nr:MFS transporter [Erysipelotrichaceae bacterium]